MQDQQNNPPALLKYPLANLLEASPPKLPIQRIWLIPALLIMCLISGTVVWWNLNPSTPAKTLQTFCNAIDRGDQATVDSLYTPQLLLYAHQISSKLIYCKPRPYEGDHSICAPINARFSLTAGGVLIVYFTYSWSGQWKIEDIVAPIPNDICLQ